MVPSPQNPDSEGAIPVRSAWKTRINALRKRSPLNPYWIEHKWLVKAVEFLAPHARGDLLDVGVGERPYGVLFDPHVTSYVGLEYPPVADTLYPEIWQILDRIRGIVDVFGDGQRMPILTNTFDTVLALEVFEHLPEPDACMAEIDRVLRPGGTLLFTVPFVAPLHQLPFDYCRFTPRGIESLLERHGFEVKLIMARGNFASAMGSTVAHWALRTFGADRRHADGSVQLSRWRAPLISPFLAVTQLTAVMFERMTSDMTSTLGYSVVARRPGESESDKSRPSNSSNGANTTSQS